MATETDTSYARGMGSMQADYNLYGAQQDPFVRSVSQVLTDKTGLDDSISRDLVLMLQRALGLQNRGVDLYAGVQAGISRGGMLASTPSGYNGLLGGYNVASMQASSVLGSSIRSHFYDSRGLPMAAARNLTMTELGQLSSHVLGSGAGSRFGPLYRSEVMTQGRIDKLMEEGRNRLKDTGDRSLFDEASRLKVGQFRFTETSSIRRFKSYMEDAAETVSTLKELFGGREIADLDAAFQMVLGGSLSEFGNKAARIKLAGIKASANTMFGGDTMAAMSWHAQQNFDISGGIAARMGVDPNSPMAQQMFGLIASNIAMRTGTLGIVGGRSQVTDSGIAARYGIGVRSTSDFEIQSRINQGTSQIATEEKEALALSRFLQERGSTLSDEQRNQIRSALGEIGGAGSGNELVAARMRAGSLFQNLAGVTVGEYVGSPEDQARMMAQLQGEGAAAFGSTSAQALQSRMQRLLRSRFENDRTLRGLGLDGKTAGVLGSGLANLSEAQYAELIQRVEGGAIGDLLSNPDIAATLSAAGVDSAAFGSALGGMSADKLAVLRSKRNQYRDTASFVAEGDIRQETRNQLDDFMARNQNGKTAIRSDIVTEFIKGIYGDEEVTPAQLVAEAGRLGIGTSSIKVGADGIIAGDDSNVAALTKALGPGVWAALGLKEGDTAGLTAALATPEGSLKALQLMSEPGAYSYKDGKFEFLDESKSAEVKAKLEGEAIASVASAFVGSATTDMDKFGRRSGESVEAYRTRIRRANNASIGSADIGGLVAEASTNEGFMEKILAAQELGLNSSNRAKLLEGIDAVSKDLDTQLGKEGLDDEEKNNLAERLDRLDRLKKELDSGVNKAASETVNVTATTVNITNTGGKQP